MLENVSDRKLYHVTVTKPYKQALVANQKILAGSEYNPFFRFYEGVIEYPVTHNGGTIQVKAVAWLRRVHEKAIATNPEILASIAYDVTRHYVMLCRELIMEEVRKEEFSANPPSRQRCLYLCDSLEEARYWKGRLGGGTVCELMCTGTLHRADARLLLADSEPLSVTRDRARAYWRGEKGDNPEMETLFVGDATVIAIVP